jgi:hypothetical protein
MTEVLQTNISTEQLEKIGEIRDLLDDRLQYGCVPRAIESFFGVEATDEQWALRIEDVKNKLAECRAVESRHPDTTYQNLYRQQLQNQDVRDVVKYLDQIKTSNTPLGEAIHEACPIYTVRSGQETLDILHSGEELLAIWFYYSDQFQGLGGHMSHLKYYRFYQTLRSPSDNFEQKQLVPEATYHLFRKSNWSPS